MGLFVDRVFRGRDHIESVMMRDAKVNPNVKQAYVAMHNYGSNSGDILIVNVYETWEAISAPCGDPCREWREANQVERGSEEWNERRERTQTFMKYYGSHQDEIYWALFRYQNPLGQ